MTPLRLLLAATLATLTACTGSVQTTGGGPGPSRPMPPPDNRPDRPPAAPAWDSTGWTLLGTQQVNGNTDRDTMRVARAARWDKLTLVVSDSDLDLLDFTVVFSNGERWSPKLKHRFHEGERTRTIDLPGDDRHIASIELLYKNTPGGGAARLEVYAKDVRNPRPPVVVNEPPPPPVTPPVPPPIDKPFDPKEWTLLGTQSIEGKKDRDTYVVVKGSDLEMLDFVVTFENKEKWEPKLAHTFREGQRSHAIELPGSDRYIEKIDVKYGNLPGGGKATVQLYARDTKEGMDPKGKDNRNKDEQKDPKDPKYKPKK
jgi:hypothetical protein